MITSPATHMILFEVNNNYYENALQPTRTYKLMATSRACFPGTNELSL